MKPDNLKGGNIIDTLKLTDIFDIDLLQRLQDAFYTATGIPIGISNQNGVAITQHCSCNDFCTEFNKKSPIGLSRCEECDKKGMELAISKGGPVTYTCHAGLLDFAAPITVEGRVLGCFLGGQVMDHPLDEAAVRKYAEELDIDPDAYLEAARQLKDNSRERIENASSFLYTIGDILSHMAYKKYHVMLENSEIEREAHMKSDFLANMSHEIRTPMNAVIGMAEMALREELPPAARDYINQIKTAGNTLLTIINDILDFSKIESGKMDINMCEYEPSDVINDITNIIMTRIDTKNLDLIVDLDPNMPKQLMGDNIRIKQVIINLANNAVKFTREGMVKLTVGFTKKAEREILLQVSVQDTGIGIKKEDMNKLFQSFQQLDSKRNRNIEGSGLGLAISKQLVSLMNGDLRVESEYEVGSTFSFELPQLILDDHTSVSIAEEQPITAMILSDNPCISTQLQTDIERFGATCISLANVEELKQHVPQQQEYLFIDHPMFNDTVREYILQNQQITAILMIGFRTILEYNIPNLLIVKKPLYSLNIGALFNHEDIHKNFSQSSDGNYDFIAPEAKILIVDDNQVNLTVAQGLMEPLKMEIDTALSGKEAIEKISVQHYDLIFMDHMMPELDGIETTHIIRRFHEEYNDVPIIALTANAMEEMRSMFLCEGMNDFIAKPLEVRILVSKLKQWLPKEKIEKSYNSKENQPPTSQETLPEIEGLDTKLALKYLGNENLFWEVLKDFYRLIEKKADLIEKLAAEENWNDYTVEVHALKSAARQIGAIDLSEKAAALEQAGKDENADFITPYTAPLLKDYRRFEEILSPYCQKEQKSDIDKSFVSSEDLQEIFDKMKTALEDLDMDGMDEVVAKLDSYRYEAEQAELFSQLKNAVEEMDVDTCASIIEQWEEKISA